MFTAVDHHLGGRYAESIDRFRLNTLHFLLSEIDAAEFRFAELQTRHSWHAGEMARERQRLQDAQRLCTAMEIECQRLTEENRTLRAFYDTWRRPMIYRIAREVRRPARQIWDYARRLVRHSDGPPPAVPTSSKAA
jgi:hypothetical protein